MIGKKEIKQLKNHKLNLQKKFLEDIDKMEEEVLNEEFPMHFKIAKIKYRMQIITNEYIRKVKEANTKIEKLLKLKDNENMKIIKLPNAEVMAVFANGIKVRGDNPEHLLDEIDKLAKYKIEEEDKLKCSKCDEVLKIITTYNPYTHPDNQVEEYKFKCPKCGDVIDHE